MSINRIKFIFQVHLKSITIFISYNKDIIKHNLKVVKVEYDPILMEVKVELSLSY